MKRSRRVFQPIGTLSAGPSRPPSCALQALFATLVGGCGPILDDGSDDAAEDTTSTTTATTTYEPTTTHATPGPMTDSHDGYDPDYGHDDGCWAEPWTEEIDVLRAELEPWLDRSGQISDELCWQVCTHMFPALPWDHVDACTVTYADSMDDGSTTTSDSTGSGDTTGSRETDGNEDERIRLECDGFLQDCGVGRAHAVLRSSAKPSGRDAMGRWAAAAAHAEAGSVGSFLALRDELEAHGAPPELLARAVEAALDEIIHARMMARLAHRHGATPTAPVFDKLTQRSLEAFAIENAVEGCVRETWSALEATHQARAAADPLVRTIMRRIAIDETRHAQLAHDIDAWLRTKLDDEALARVDGARARAVIDLEHILERRRHATVLECQAGLPARATARRLTAGLRATVWS